MRWVWGVSGNLFSVLIRAGLVSGPPAHGTGCPLPRSKQPSDDL